MADVVLKNIKKVYPNIEPKKKKKGEPEKEKKNNLLVTEEGVLAVHDFNLEIKDNEFIVLVGPSGCGKSTTLRMIAGLEEISGGELYIDGKLMNDIPPKDRDIAMVFQNYALYPHMTVYENMAFGLKLRHVDPQEIDRKVKEAAEILDITQYLDRKPKALSGGQRQRVAIGRAIVRSPKVFLMDEPLSNLDAKLRNQMRAEIIKLRQRIDTTFIYVTHDQTEAMTLGDRIVTGDLKTIMAGLACGEPNTISWDILRNHVSAFISCPDWVSAKGMRMLSSPVKGDPRVVSGESGAVGMGVLDAIMCDDTYKELRDALELDRHSRVLMFSTEGNTDPEKYRRVVWDGEYPTDDTPQKPC